MYMLIIVRIAFDINVIMPLSLQVAMATFTTYSMIHRDDPNPENRLTPDKAFVALSLFNILRLPLQLLPVVITVIIQVHTCTVTCTKIRNTHVHVHIIICLYLS